MVGSKKEAHEFVVSNNGVTSWDGRILVKCISGHLKYEQPQIR